MSELIRDNWKFLLAALALHAAAGVVLTTSFSSTIRKIEPGQLAIQARVIDQAAIRRARERQAAEERKAEEQRQAKERAEQEARDREAEEQRQREQEVERQKKAAEEKTQLIAKQKADKQKQADQQRADTQRKQREQANKKKAEQEARAQAQREAELRQQMAEEESRMQARSSGLMNQYVALIQQHIMRHWNKPASARPGIECEVKVTQVPGGVVTAARVGKCNGDQVVRQSIESAVIKASPLPAPPDPRLFERDLLINFKPDE